MGSYRWGILAVLILLGYALYRDNPFAPATKAPAYTAQDFARDSSIMVVYFDTTPTIARKPVIAKVNAKLPDIFLPQEAMQTRFEIACDKILLEYSGCAAGTGFEPVALGDNFELLKIKVLDE